jgi:hypothetical protein
MLFAAVIFYKHVNLNKFDKKHVAHDVAMQIMQKLILLYTLTV